MTSIVLRSANSGSAPKRDRFSFPNGGKMKIPRWFYEQNTVEVARQLLGKYLVRQHAEGTTVGRIVETEAYVGPEDKACHAARGRTARTEVMFGEPGHAYVYFIYGFHYMLNIVTEREGFPAAVLIRAVQPIRGMSLMKKRRGTDEPRSLASGPGKLCQAFAIDRSLNGDDVCGSVLYVRDAGEPAPEIIATPRIGVDYAGEWKRKPLRFLICGNAFVSKP
jgi:DNA-3-methyladenine glycosylase